MIPGPIFAPLAAAVGLGFGWWCLKYEGRAETVKVRTLGLIVAVCSAIVMVMTAKEWIQALLH
jgi:hypothetical protein